jgi:hypothetical protein
MDIIRAQQEVDLQRYEVEQRCKEHKAVVDEKGE